MRVKSLFAVVVLVVPVLVVSIGLGASVLVAATAAAEVVVSGVKGGVTQQVGSVAALRPLSEDQMLETGDDGNLAVVIDDNAVAEVCGKSQVKFSHAPEGNRIVNVEGGTLRMVVEPRAPGERIEIHTPAAVATILGTVVYVTVDPVTGATTISSSESQVNVRAKGASLASGTTIGAMEQIALTPGQAQTEQRTLDERQIESIGDCLTDFHSLALELDRINLQKEITIQVAATDAATSSLPPVGVGPGGAPVPPPGGGGGNVPPPPPFTPVEGSKGSVNSPGSPTTPPGGMGGIGGQPACTGPFPQTGCSF